jgi:hypothetical protein
LLCLATGLSIWVDSTGGFPVKFSIILVAIALMALASSPAAAQSGPDGAYRWFRAYEFGSPDWAFLGLGDALRLRQRDGDGNGEQAWVRTRLRVKDGSCAPTKTQLRDQARQRDQQRAQTRLQDGPCLQDPVMEQQRDRKGR